MHKLGLYVLLLSSNYDQDATLIVGWAAALLLILLALTMFAIFVSLHNLISSDTSLFHPQKRIE